MLKALMGAVAAISITVGTSKAQAFDFDNGNAAVQVVIPAIVPDVLFSRVSPSGGDATLVLRVTTMVTNAWFDATAPWHPTAKGVYSHLDRQGNPGDLPPATNRDMNIALLHASRHVLDSLLPEESARWAAMLDDVGLDSSDTEPGPTPAGIGNAAGLAVVAGRESDGMNQLGFDDGRAFNPVPYADYTGYEPVNTAYELEDPRRWQPDLQRLGMGLYRIQQFVTPQYALVEPYSYLDPQQFGVPRPRNTQRLGQPFYKGQADEVLEASANLTEEQKLKAELFDNKIISLGLSAVIESANRGQSLLEFVQLDFLTNMAAFDAGILIWQEKREHDAVRPFSAIREIYGDDEVFAYSGDPDIGATWLPANEWKSYLEEADHPEYPSASACFCSAHTTSARLFLGDDNIFFPTSFPAGSSRVEPGFTPAADTTVTYTTWSDFNADCGQSRVWAGVHFQAAVDESRELCPVFGEMAYDYLLDLIDGVAALRPPSAGRPVETLD